MFRSQPQLAWSASPRHAFNLEPQAHAWVKRMPRDIRTGDNKGFAMTPAIATSSPGSSSPRERPSVKAAAVLNAVTAVAKFVTTVYQGLLSHEGPQDLTLPGPGYDSQTIDTELNPSKEAAQLEAAFSAPAANELRQEDLRQALTDALEYVNPDNNWKREKAFLARQGCWRTVAGGAQDLNVEVASRLLQRLKAPTVFLHSVADVVKKHLETAYSTGAGLSGTGCVKRARKILEVGIMDDTLVRDVRDKVLAKVLAKAAPATSPPPLPHVSTSAVVKPTTPPPPPSSPAQPTPAPVFQASAPAMHATPAIPPCPPAPATPATAASERLDTRPSRQAFTSSPTQPPPVPVLQARAPVMRTQGPGVVAYPVPAPVVPSKPKPKRARRVQAVSKAARRSTPSTTATQHTYSAAMATLQPPGTSQAAGPEAEVGLLRETERPEPVVRFRRLD